MPADGFSAVLAVIGGLLVVGGLWTSIHLRLWVRTRTGGSVSVNFDVDRTPAPGTDEESTGAATGR
jgi:hypothetical protein